MNLEDNVQKDTLTNPCQKTVQRKEPHNIESALGNSIVTGP